MKISTLVSSALASLALLAGTAQSQGVVQKMTSRPVQTPVGFQVVNTLVPGTLPATDGRIIAFQTDELLGGDLDGDMVITPGRRVIQYYVIKTGIIVNTMQAGRNPSVSKGHIAFARWEQNGFNQDLNGDGDFLDNLIAYYHIPSGATLDTFLDGRFPDIDGDFIAFETVESGVSPFALDLNGDGDTADTVILYYQISIKTPFNTSAAGALPSISGNRIVFSTFENECWDGVFLTEPGVPNPPDLDGDGDLTDDIIREHSILTGMTLSTGLDGVRPTVDGARLAFGFDEVQNAPDLPLDADVDADAVDLVLQLYNLNTGTFTNSMLPIDATPTIAGRYVAYDLEERFLGFSLPPAFGTDLNGNAFKQDHIVCFYDRLKKAFTSTGVEGFCVSGDNMAGHIIAFEYQNTGQIGYIRLL